jgi:hypothetical protein
MYTGAWLRASLLDGFAHLRQWRIDVADQLVTAAAPFLAAGASLEPLSLREGRLMR